jgi:Xaa-Pro dipeptidase
MYLGVDGTLALLTRSADLIQAEYTSLIEDIRVWVDRGDANPGEDLRHTLDTLGCRGKRLGVELEAYSLTGRRWDMVRHALEGLCTLVDASDVVQRFRVIKSEAELDYVKRAAVLADDALEAAYANVKPGVSEGHLFAVMNAAVFEGGGDYTGSRFIIGCGEGALLIRNFTGRETIGDNDQIQLEFGAAYRHYHACLMRTALTGRVNAQHRAMHAACVDALAACQEVCTPGKLVGDVFDAHARVFDAAGYREYRLNACGYSLSANYPPSWMEQPMFFAGSTTVIEPSMVFFMHMILLDNAKKLTMSLGETGIVTPSGFQRLSRMSHDLCVN